MAGIEEEPGKLKDDPGAASRDLHRHSVQVDLPENDGGSKPLEIADAEKGDSAEAPPPVDETSDTPLLESQIPINDQLPMDLPAQNSQAEVPIAEAKAPEPAPLPPKAAAVEPAKPRSLFPALAATALAGALLGLGGSFGLRFLENPRTKPQPSEDRLAELNTRLEAFEKKEAAATSASRSALSAMEARVTAAEGAAHNAEELAKTAEADIQKAAAAQPTGREPSNFSAAPGDAPDLGPIEGRLTALEQKLASTGPETAAPKTSWRAEADQENRSTNEIARAEEIAIVAGNLLRKLDHGEEFSADLAALENLGIPEPALAPLRAAAASTVSTVHELTAQFANLSEKIIAAELAALAKPDESFLDQVARNAKGLVDIRRVGDSSAEDVQSLVTRIETALADHDVEDAYKAWTQLPSLARNVAPSWGEAAKSRLDAVHAAKSFEADAVAVLGKTKR